MDCVLGTTTSVDCLSVSIFHKQIIQFVQNYLIHT